MKYDQQVPVSHYSFSKYFFPGRWMSYYHQTKEIGGRPDIQTVLDIGPGTTFLRDALQIHRDDIAYTTMDIAPDVQPDIIGGVTKMPVADQSYDAVCAFQVLEHIAYADVPAALAEMNRVSKQYVFISLPHFGPSFELQLKLPLLPRLRLACKLWYPKRHEFQGQHYWEIGKRGYSVRTVRAVLKKQFQIIDEYVPFENQYHRFFILKKYE